MVVLRLPSASAKPPTQKDLEIKDPGETTGENDAFVAKRYDISEFKGSNTIEISLRKSFKGSKRKKREINEVYELKPDATYTLAQMNEDKSGVSHLSKPAWHLFITEGGHGFEGRANSTGK